MIATVYKTLTKNDLGLTGSHQAGICVPFKIVHEGFFPKLDVLQYNPRTEIPICFQGVMLKFNYIYYNSKLLKKGTRNEYRLTGMSRFFFNNGCKEGDILVFKLYNGNYSVDIVHQMDENITSDVDLDKPLVIKADWIYKRG